MPTFNTTPNRGYEEPAIGNTLAVDVGQLIAALRKIDIDMANALAAIVAKANLASPAFSGVPTAPTAAPGTDTGQLATTAFVRAAVVALIDSSPGALDTLNELAAALGDDPNFSTTVLDAIGLKADAAATTAALALKSDEADTDTPNLTAKTTPVDADSFRIWDSVGAAFKKVTFANLKAWIQSWLPITKFYESGELTIAGSGAFTLTHGLGGEPKLVQFLLICKTADLGFAVGDKVPIGDSYYTSSSSSQRGLVSWLSATEIGIRLAADVNPIALPNKNTGSIGSLTNANWRIIVRAWA